MKQTVLKALKGRWFVLAGALAMVWFVAALIPKPAPVPTGPMLLKEVKDLGELRTVSHRASRVFEFESHKTLEGWSARVPLAKEVLAAATSNKVLVSAEGEVMAGIDLSQARIEEAGSGWLVVLPSANVYEPTVTVNVHAQKDGAFWRDLNIVPKAQKQMSEELVEASKAAGIRERAEENARSTVVSLLGGMTDKRVEVVFEGGRG